MAGRWSYRVASTITVAGLALVMGTGTAWATNINSTKGYAAPPILTQTDVTWDGNGAPNGVCESVGVHDDLTPGPGEQGWLFVMSQPFDGTGSELSFNFSDGTMSPPTVAGDFTGGTYHYAVYTAAGATLISASATNGTHTDTPTPHVASNLVVSHCELGEQVPPSASLTSEVHLADHTVASNGSPGTAPATVHDKVTLTVTGLSEWTGEFTLDFYESNDCSGDPADTTSFTWDSTDPSTQDDLLPQGPLDAGGYSYQESFDSDNNALDTTGACEPFQIGTTTTTTTSPPGCTDPSCLPTTGVALTGLLAAGVAMVVGGMALIIARRRRDLVAATPAGAIPVDLGSTDGPASTRDTDAGPAGTTNPTVTD
jgi:LPXTG-motif cell wall-anchored protein